MPIRASSRGLTNGYSGTPLPRTRTKSGTDPAAKRISPRTRSVHARSSSGIRSRSTGSRPLGPEGRLLLVGEEAVVVVVAELGVLPGREAAGVDLLVGGERLVGVPGRQQ